ncbi:hypothetical protein Q0590_28330 [Rhodocytophaga aerolata]|uniref:Universal stress protein n=1 Tax=Rhodocytophaga aerolata TaxID=455078 RepID=A0ABT8REU9_9BACT|nr:hypothetical protein [Rhodocytophaga aerolata]MDO1450221.1 hypothetical protein [Rhodocytophaga aerolata]
MKNILIPSDFTLQSLDCVEDVVQSFKSERITIVFVHVFIVSSSIVDLMLLSRRRKEYSYISDQFWNECKRLEKEYSERINSIKVECFYGNTVAVFKNYLEGLKIDLIVYPQLYTFKQLCKESCDPAKLIAKSGREVWMLAAKKKPKEVRQFRWVRNMSYQLSLN